MKDDLELGLSLAQRVHPKYRPVFDAVEDAARAALALYFLPHASRKKVLEPTRPRVLKWYCPFADQRVFPSGHRYCVNVYTGCEHRCQYCYAAGYVDARPNCKRDFRAALVKDLDALDECDVPPAPVHLSNSTDPLQPLEQEHRDALFALEQLAQRRHRFTSVTLLTKNPAALLADTRYIAALQRLRDLPGSHARHAAWNWRHPPLRLECSLAFHSDEHRLLMDPVAPSAESRREALRVLREHGIPVFVRIDPLFPRDPLLRGRCMADFDLPDVQSLADLENLVQFCRQIEASAIIYSVAKITRPKSGELGPTMARMKRVYEHLAGDGLVFRGGSWRLPPQVANESVLRGFLEVCRCHAIPAVTCKANLISTP